MLGLDNSALDSTVSVMVWCGVWGEAGSTDIYISGLSCFSNRYIYSTRFIMRVVIYLIEGMLTIYFRGLAQDQNGFPHVVRATDSYHRG